MRTPSSSLGVFALLLCIVSFACAYTYDNGNSDLQNAFDAFLRDIVVDGEYYELFEQFYGIWTSDDPYSPLDCALNRAHWPLHDAIADDGALQDILANKMINVVASNLCNPGAITQNDDGTFTGFEVELIRLFAKFVANHYGVEGTIDVSVSLYGDHVSDAVGTFAVDSKKHLLVGALTNTVGRRAEVNFACGSLNTVPVLLIGPSLTGVGSSWSAYNSSTFTVCVERDTLFDTYRETYIPATRGLLCSSLSETPCFSLLESGSCDLMIIDNMTATYVKLHSDELPTSVIGPQATAELGTIAVAISKDAPFYYYGNELLVQTWNEAYRLFDWASAQASTMANTTTAPPPELNIDTSYVMERNDVRYPTGVLRTVLDIGLLRIGYIPWPGFHDVADNGTHTGFEVLMAENFISYILDQYGVSLVPVWVDMSAKSIREVVQALQDGDVTLVLGGVLSRSDRTSSGTFGGLYYTTEMTVLANTAVGVGAVTDIAALNVPTTTACKYSINRCADLTDSHLSAATVVQMDTMDECLDAVASGAADVFLCTRVMFENARDADPTLAATTAVWDGTVTRGEFMAPVFRNDALAEQEEEADAVDYYTISRMIFVCVALVVTALSCFSAWMSGCLLACGFMGIDQTVTLVAEKGRKLE
ncbi:Bacterial extracellular solute-binding proteins family 3 [Carpediemonas membranifera]|uniref:Bacterial extracellular solute-binding proteins family 3 n=1 Tax=Carpediemonas membranifera TaxID=201153 RepID=A0A8J6AVH5_9EUKA|nr:Bacterial extracellular solute-binding proteins family 3 [Carpediemonas membranifera]|eukprot:KAG9395821.1 Bacterial extracellular solute-binding proteins family 3 [Carpediemonas membranifera]